MSLAALVSCANVQVANTEVCAVAGVMAAGMDCAETLSQKTRSMDLTETIKFLEPQLADPVKKTPARGAAMCQSADDWNKQKTALESACKILGKSCTYEIKMALATAENNISTLQAKVASKKKPDQKK